MTKVTALAMVAGAMFVQTVLHAQATSATLTVLLPPQGMVPITGRLEPRTLHGTIVEISCFRTKGAATVSTPEQIECAKDAVAKRTGVIAILTDGDGSFKLVGALTANNYAKLVPYLGKQVDMPGAEVLLSNNFDYHAFEPKAFSPAK